MVYRRELFHRTTILSPLRFTDENCFIASPSFLRYGLPNGLLSVNLSDKQDFSLVKIAHI